MPARKNAARTPAGASGRSDLVVVANRLSVDRVVGRDGSTSWRRSPGGLVTALEPVLRRHRGAWIGWPGGPIQDTTPFELDGLTLVPVPLTEDEVGEYYEGFSNATLWPLYHDVIVAPEFHREWWDSYVQVNQRFAARAAEIAADKAVVWVHDYQLQLVPQLLRVLRPDLRIGFFLHIPFPPTELFMRLPWRRRIIEGLLGADLVGFQVPGAAANFARLVRTLTGHKTHRDLVTLSDGRTVRARAFPISIDTDELSALAKSPETEARAKELRAEVGNPRHVLLGVDRMDYTKGIRQRLRAFGELLQDGHVTVDDAVLIQVATPSRERVEQYRVLRDEIDRMVGNINGDHGRIGTPAINYMHTSFSRKEMAALFLAADIMVVTPLRDGMNLVAKEYVTCRHSEDGALVLSEFAGAAAELKQAFLVNPYDINGLKETLLAATHADSRDVTKRMRAMRKYILEHDIGRWASGFLDALTTP
ncbi:MAG: trehalose-6-phosphate synthase [Propionibacteriales bacterium]|nr:trehalose-6-phosphate synthase [Propionibacteriales bacterium]